MTINLITKKECKFLLDSYKKHPALTLQNQGYEKINRDKLSDLDKAKIKEIEALLGKSIVGFSSFQNFKLSTKNKVGLRFQYNYDADYEGGGNKIYFIGVGYILVNELLVGFKPAPKQKLKEPTK
jgi:hypothetical protein